MPAPSAQLLAPSARALLFDPPAERDEALRRCALAPEDLALARRHRRSHNQLGFAVQLALVRDLGRPLRLDEAPPAAVVEADGWTGFAERFTHFRTGGVRSPRPRDCTPIPRLRDHGRRPGDFLQQPHARPSPS